MSNKVWVTCTWNSEPINTRVDDLAEDDIIDDLRKKFVKQQSLDGVVPYTLSVSTADGTALSVDTPLKRFWVTSSDSAAQSGISPGPGQVMATALVVTFLQPQQQNSK
jgi:hypothetical protein